MYDPVTISKYFPTWRIDMGAKNFLTEPTIAGFGVGISLVMTLYYVRAVKREHHILIVFDRWQKETAESLVEMMMSCELAGD